MNGPSLHKPEYAGSLLAAKIHNPVATFLLVELDNMNPDQTAPGFILFAI